MDITKLAPVLRRWYERRRNVTFKIYVIVHGPATWTVARWGNVQTMRNYIERWSQSPYVIKMGKAGLYHMGVTTISPQAMDRIITEQLTRSEAEEEILEIARKHHNRDYLIKLAGDFLKWFVGLCVVYKAAPVIIKWAEDKFTELKRLSTEELGPALADFIAQLTAEAEKLTGKNVTEEEGAEFDWELFLKEYGPYIMGGVGMIILFSIMMGIRR